jgi:hypothetical protein
VADLGKEFVMQLFSGTPPVELKRMYTEKEPDMLPMPLHV